MTAPRPLYSAHLRPVHIKRPDGAEMYSPAAWSLAPVPTRTWVLVLTLTHVAALGLGLLLCSVIQ